MKRGYTDVLIGLQYGDEGKARVIDKLLQKVNYSIVAKFNAGPNAGHVIEVENKRVILHSVPAGVFYSDKLLYVGSGCVINPEKFLQEISDIEKIGVGLKNRLRISSNISLIQPHHIILDNIQGGFIGTTRNGVGPVYADQAVRAEDKIIKNLKIGSYLSDPEGFRNYVMLNLKNIVEIYKINFEIYVEQFVQVFHDSVLQLREYVEYDPFFLDKLVGLEKNILFEGANSCMLDVVYGVTPFTTSSRTIAAAAYTGGDISLKHHNKIIGVAKAIMSRVGNGPFISEYGGRKSEEYCGEDAGKKYIKEVEEQSYNVEELLKSWDLFKIGIALRILGNEYGSTTKRPRRLGIFDLVLLKQSCRLNAVDEIYINKIDCLYELSKTSLSGIPIVTSYVLNGKLIDYVPTTSEDMYNARPVIEYWPHISDVSSAKTYEELSVEVKYFIKTLQERICVKIAGIGVGPEREQFIEIIE